MVTPSKEYRSKTSFPSSPMDAKAMILGSQGVATTDTTTTNNSVFPSSLPTPPRVLPFDDDSSLLLTTIPLPPVPSSPPLPAASCEAHNMEQDVENGLPSKSSNEETATITEASYWKSMFEMLRDERETSVERQYQALQEESHKREASLCEYISFLERQVQELRQHHKVLLEEKKVEMEKEKENIPDTKENTDPVSPEDQKMDPPVEQHSSLSEHDKRQHHQQQHEQQDFEKKDESIQKQHLRQWHKKAMKLQRIVGHYRLLTSLAIGNTSNDANTFDCKLTNPETKVYTRFRLTTWTDQGGDEEDDDDDNEEQPEERDGKDEGSEGTLMVKFEPLSHAEHLPQFLQEAIEFESSQCPCFLKNVLQGMFPDQDDENDADDEEEEDDDDDGDSALHAMDGVEQEDYRGT